MWSRSVPVGEIRSVGDAALVVGVSDPRAAQALTRMVSQAERPGVAPVVGGLATVMVGFDPDFGDKEVEDLREWLRQLFGAATADEHRVDAEQAPCAIPTVFDGPDLDVVAEFAGATTAQVIEMFTDCVLTVAVVGFSPGFAYLEGLPDALAQLPRRSRPRPVVPAGSVALANGNAAVYPSASPGGWQLIGRTRERFFHPETAPYARLTPGDRVQFVAESALAEPAAPPVPPAVPRPTEPLGAPTFTVEQAGIRTLLQDAGRLAHATIGVPAASPADPTSFVLANRLVGNPSNACALEVMAQGPRLRCLRSTYVAVVGAPTDVSLDSQPVAQDQVVPLTVGQVLEVGRVRGGLRSYVAVAGGFVGPEVLGSQSTDLLAAIGPGAIAAGTHLFAGSLTPPLGDHLLTNDIPSIASHGVIRLRVVPGPHPEHFVDGAFESLRDRRFTVEADSNKVGLRLQPSEDDPAFFDTAESHELDSQGMVIGAVQVPPNGHPVILGPDHATLGGYPVLAVVATVDHGLIGQCAPGAAVALVPNTHGEARQALATHRRHMATAVVGHYPFAVE